MEDLIERGEVIKASWEALYDYQDEMETKFRESEGVDFGDWFIHRIFVQGVHGEILNRIVDIPSSERRSEWKNYKDEHYCSHCGEVVISDWYTEDEWYDFCPYCGARMK